MMKNMMKKKKVAMQIRMAQEKEVKMKMAKKMMMKKMNQQAKDKDE